MTSLGDWMYRTLTGRTEPRPLGGFLEQLAEVRARTGSVAGTARLAGLPRRTVRYWFERLAQGKTVKPKANTLEKLSSAVREARLSPARPSDAQVSINTRDNDRGTPRTISARQLQLRPGTIERCARVWVQTGDSEQAAREFLRGVGDGWYRAYLTPRDAERDDRTERVVPRAEEDEADFEEDDLIGDFGPDDEVGDDDEFWPYDDDLRGEEYEGASDEGYGGTVEG